MQLTCAANRRHPSLGRADLEFGGVPDRALRRGAFVNVFREVWVAERLADAIVGEIKP